MCLLIQLDISVSAALHVITRSFAYIAAFVPLAAFAQIPQADDAPKPLTPLDAAKTLALPDGFQFELVVSEPIIREPSGVAFDARGRIYVCELHGYNLEGQYDIEELNKTGQLDREVRRIQAPPKAKEAAEAETYSTIKLLQDSDGDGKIDNAIVWADQIPPCLGICPTQDGLVAACQTQILFLADRDGDNLAEVREVWFEGFEKGPLERTINNPQWGLDNWIYIGNGAGGGTIRGKYLNESVDLPRTDFRIKPDGSAIEPVVGSTGTVGFAFTEGGDRFVISTNTPGIFVAPLPWKDLARNPSYSPGRLEENAASSQRVYPTSQPHPWRTRRAEDPGFSKFYTDRYGIAESAPNGYFTSACSPLVYQDTVLPGLSGHVLSCEPAQNLVHRSVVHRDGSRLKLSRPSEETTREFLTSTDTWFHPIALSHAPDGSILVIDFYREIIEDYSAIPRYLQQQYGLKAGYQHGRIWRLKHESMSPAPWFGSAADMSKLTQVDLVGELANPRLVRRQTARRLLVEANAQSMSAEISKLLTPTAEASTIFNALSTLDGLSAIAAPHVEFALEHPEPTIRRFGLQLSQAKFDNERLVAKVILMAGDPSPLVRLHVALALGDIQSSESVQGLARLARQHGEEPWMSDALMSSVGQRPLALFQELVQHPNELGAAATLLEPLCATISYRRDASDISDAIQWISQLGESHLQVRALRGLASTFRSPEVVKFNDATAATVRALLTSDDSAVGSEAANLMRALQLESTEERSARLARAMQALDDHQRSAQERLDAVTQLSRETEDGVAAALIAAIPTATPQIRDAILQSLFAQRDRLGLLLEAIANGSVAPSMLSVLQRTAMLESSDPSVRTRATKLLQPVSKIEPELFDKYASALANDRDIVRGQAVFQDHCAKCHQAHGIGQSVGPDLSAEFGRAEETIIRDVLAPSDNISAGYGTYVVETEDGQVVTGVIVSESPTSIALVQADGVERTLLRTEIEQLRAMTISMMPEDLHQLISPSDLAHALAWLRRPPSNLVLVDENRSLVDSLTQGEGTARFIDSDAWSGRLSLRITPPQRYASNIEGWQYKIREQPGAGEYRYLRLAWKTPQASESATSCGVMIELAADGRWPRSDSNRRRYHSGRNLTEWKSTEISADAPGDWTVVTVDLWRDAGDFTLTGIAPTAMGGPVLFDRIELLREL